MGILPLRLSWASAEDRWANVIDPVLQLPPNQGVIQKNITLNSGVNVINTKLGQTQQGWIVTDIDAVATVYRSAPFNNITLTLTASAPCTVSLWMW